MAIRDLWILSVAMEPKMSALPPKADIRLCDYHARFGAISRSPITYRVKLPKRIGC
jgi:hypothetical protein